MLKRYVGGFLDWGTLPPTDMAPDKGSIEKDIDLPSTLPQML